MSGPKTNEETCAVCGGDGKLPIWNGYVRPRPPDMPTIPCLFCAEEKSGE